MRQVLAAVFLSALAIAAMMGLIGSAGAADLADSGDGQMVNACGQPQEEVILFQDNGLFEHGYPTVVARTPYFTCVTGTVLLPGDIPPPPEYCCH